MSNKMTLNKYKNYLTMIEALPGSQLFQHLYLVDENGQEIDATKGGDLSCALVVSWILHGFGWIDSPHATVNSTLKAMVEHGWRETSEPKPGDVVHWPPNHHGIAHVGFYLGDGKFISNNDEAKTPILHDEIHYGNPPDAFYTREYDV
ncbi:NlpC/P60 family protein [Candidatus Saccharibacteria bacterium]|nr:NlpC/P60 family protein [Candidatus Saccharibacteria bacterium]